MRGKSFELNSGNIELVISAIKKGIKPKEIPTLLVINKKLLRNKRSQKPKNWRAKRKRNKMSYLKGEMNLIQTIKIILMIIGGAIGIFGILKIAYYTEKIYFLMVAK